MSHGTKRSRTIAEILEHTGDGIGNTTIIDRLQGEKVQTIVELSEMAVLMFTDIDSNWEENNIMRRQLKFRNKTTAGHQFVRELEVDWASCVSQYLYDGDLSKAFDQIVPIWRQWILQRNIRKCLQSYLRDAEQ